MTPTLAPEVIAAIDAREKLGLRTDLDWVRGVQGRHAPAGVNAQELPRSAGRSVDV